MDLTNYLETIRTTSKSIFGEMEKYDNYEDMAKQSPLLNLFFEDNDLQEITICSANMGFVNTYRKFYLKDKEWVENKIKEQEEKKK